MDQGLGTPLSLQFGKGMLLEDLGFFATAQPVACQAPLSMGLPREEYWSGLPFPTPGDLPDPGIEPVSPVSSASSELPSFIQMQQAPEKMR